MRGAPPVQMACGRDARWHWFQCGLSALAAFTFVGWLAARLEGSFATVLGLLAGAVLAGRLAARHASLPRRPSVLAWDGRVWSLDGRAGSVDVMVDLGPWMLLRFVSAPGERTRWLPLLLSQAGAQPHRCRAALHDHATVHLTADAHPPVAPNG